MVDGGGETPGPIPNPEAKPARADGTAPGREWESRLPPTQQLHTRHPPHNRSCGGCLSICVCAPLPPAAGGAYPADRIADTTTNYGWTPRHRRRALTIADFRIADTTTYTHYWCVPVDCTNQHNTPTAATLTWANAAASSIRAQPMPRMMPSSPPHACGHRLPTWGNSQRKPLPRQLLREHLQRETLLRYPHCGQPRPHQQWAATRQYK